MNKRIIFHQDSFTRGMKAFYKLLIHIFKRTFINDINKVHSQIFKVRKMNLQDTLNESRILTIN